MNIKYIKIILFTLILTGCSQREYINQTTSLLSQQSRRIGKEENLMVEAIGGAMRDRITKVRVYFVTFREADLAEARRLVVKCIEELRNTINANKKIQKFLSPYPFPVIGIHVGVSFIKKTGGFLDYGSVENGMGGISYAYQSNNNIYYCSHNLHTQRLEDFYEEPYEEALEIVRSRGLLDGQCYSPNEL